jgi:hypothetical protein
MLHTGQVIIDLVMAVDKLPQAAATCWRNRPVRSRRRLQCDGRRRRNGLPVVYLGRHGTGRFGDLARRR